MVAPFGEENVEVAVVIVVQKRDATKDAVDNGLVVGWELSRTISNTRNLLAINDFIAAASCAANRGSGT